MSTRTVRKIVRIDEDMCNGCGTCVSPCAEGAIQVVDGKARVIKEEFCDGVGFCIGVCPAGALSIEEREANAFSEEAVHEHQVSLNTGKIHTATYLCHWCKASDIERPLLPVRYKDQSVWICVKCLPQLIHG